MKRITRAFLAVTLAGALSLTPAVSAVVQTPALTVYAHGGCHGGQHHSSRQSGVNYYYCDGHEAHLHENGACPYAAAASGDSYFYCDGHEAHLHADGSCPYAVTLPDNNTSSDNSVSGDSYFYCDGHEAHLHADGICPYAAVSNSNTTGSNGTSGSNTSADSTTRVRPGRIHRQPLCHSYYL